jgi:hypothetical protein
VQIQLTSAIDNIWLVATERAKAAGKEMAKVGVYCGLFSWSG